MEFIGEFAAIAAAFSWVVTALVLASAGRNVGATIVNALRIWIAFFILLIVIYFSYGYVWPDINNNSLMFLAISGLIGLSIGDQFLYRALVDAGPRISTLVITITPALTAVIAFDLLGESLHWSDVLGIAITMLGIGIVVLGKDKKMNAENYPHLKRGVAFAFIGALCQAFGLVFAKIGMQSTDPEINSFHLSGASPLVATYIRMCFGCIGATVILGFYLAFRRKNAERKSIRLNKTLLCIFIGALFGPVLGVWLGLVSIKHIDTGVAATLMAISPILIIPFAKIFENEKITYSSVFGAIVSIIGVTLLVAWTPI